MGSVDLKVNGQAVTLSYRQASDDLLYLLRDQLGLTGPRFGCGISQCGACTVLVDGAVTRSCVKTAGSLNGGEQVITLEGIGTAASPHPLQEAFVEEQAGQCAFCSNAMIMGALGWLNARIASGNTDVPSDQEIADYLSGQSPDNAKLNYICRCGSHLRIIAAIRKAAGRMM